MIVWEVRQILGGGGVWCNDSMLRFDIWAFIILLPSFSFPANGLLDVCDTRVDIDLCAMLCLLLDLVVVLLVCVYSPVAL